MLRLLVLLAVACPALAQESRLPDAGDIARAQAQVREIMQRIPQDNAMQAVRPSVPEVGSLPRPAAPPPDIATLAEKYRMDRAPAQGVRPAELLVMVSFSMPEPALERVIDQAERAGATLVFRGLKGDSMATMAREVQRILRGKNVSVAIHPPAFQQFGVTRVPAVVLAQPEAGMVLDNGCARPDTFVKVTGDVSLDYALEYIERKSAVWASVARRYRDRIVRGIH